jgi:preprotein translocase subunit SecD
MVDRRSSRYRKAGLSGLFLLGLTAFAFGEPLSLDVQEARSGVDERTHQPIVTVKVTKESQQALATYTQQNVGKPMELRIDGKVIMKSVIREPLIAGSFRTIGNFTAEEASDIARKLSAGTPIVIEVVD